MNRPEEFDPKSTNGKFFYVKIILIFIYEY